MKKVIKVILLALFQSVVVFWVLLFIMWMSGAWRFEFSSFSSEILIWFFIYFVFIVFMPIILSTMITYSKKPKLFFIPSLVLFILAIILFLYSQTFGGDDGYPEFILSFLIFFTTIIVIIISTVFYEVRIKEDKK